MLKLSTDGPAPTPSPVRIVQSDYLALLCVIGPVVGWCLWLAFDYFGLSLNRRGRTLDAGTSPIFLYLACGFTALCLPLLYWRVASFLNTFRNGVQVIGRVLSVDFYKDRGTVVYAFEHENREHKISRGIHKSARTRALKDGQAVVVVLDPENPQGALLRDLFV